MRLILLFTICMGCMAQLPAQNRLDEEGRKTGHWRVEYPNGSVLYEGDFVHGEPVGTMRKYYDNGALRSRLDFDTASSRTWATLYYLNGKKAAEGWFTDRKKDSVWNYFSRYDGTLKIREPYEEGQIHGQVKKYYSWGGISEVTTWEHGKREGPWKQFYPDSTARLTGQFENDSLQGTYKVFYRDSTPKVKGEYLHDRSHGTWIFYDENGDQLYSMEFRHGMAVDQEKYLELMKDSLMRFEAVSEEAAKGPEDAGSGWNGRQQF